MLKLLFKENFNFFRFEVFDNQKPVEKVYEVKQTHSAIIVNISLIEKNTTLIEADGIIGKWKDLKHPVLIKTADCLPVVLWNKTHFAFVHAGHRGLSQKILIDSKIIEFKPTFAFIGPAIHQHSYEVSADFKLEFENDLYFLENKGKFYFDLIGYASWQIKKQFPAINVQESQQCTFLSHALNSYRRNKTDKRNFNIITLN